MKKGYENELKEPEIISYAGSRRRAFCAFLLGFNQCTIAIVAEVLVIIFLSSLTSLLLIIMKYVSLAAVVKFDDMYAAALHENAIQAAVGCKLFITNKRYVRLQKKAQHKNDDHYRTPEDLDTESSKLLSLQEQKVEQIQNTLPIKIMRFVYKLYRLYFISLAFYFMPLGALLLSFAVNRPKSD